MAQGYSKWYKGGSSATAVASSVALAGSIGVGQSAWLGHLQLSLASAGAGYGYGFSQKLAKPPETLPQTAPLLSCTAQIQVPAVQFHPSPHVLLFQRMLPYFQVP
jgi:hypothetical protein